MYVNLKMNDACLNCSRNWNQGRRNGGEKWWSGGRKKKKKEFWYS
jgi:hypothetical protein